MRASLHPRETERLVALQETGLLDSALQPLHESVVKLASSLCGTPIAAISLVDEHCQWFPAIVGLDCKQTSRDLAFCAHTILHDEPLVVPDATRDPRFIDNALVTDAPGIRFYAGVPLLTAENLPLGSLCVIDTKPSAISPAQLDQLRTLAGFVSAQIELSRRMRQLDAQQELMLMVVEHATDFAMITLDARGHITSWNIGAQRLKGYQASEIIGAHYRTFFESADREELLPESILATAQSLGVAHVSGWRVRKDHTRFHISGTIRAVHGARGELTGFVKITRDDTKNWLLAQDLLEKTEAIEAANTQLEAQAKVMEQRNHELELARSEAIKANTAKSAFLANMSHEIRTPLTAIMGYADLLYEDGDIALAPEQRITTIRTIQNAGSHLLAVINDILDLSKIEADKLTIESIDTSLVSLLSEVHNLLRPRGEDKGVALATTLATPVPEQIISDPTRLRQILMNLVGNALKFTDSGSVTLSTQVIDLESESKLAFDIQDTGPGMSPAQVQRLFQPFTQADVSVTRKHGGTGLGLAICRQLANLMGGDVKLLRSSPGQGSCFRVILPLVSVPGTRMADRLDRVERASATKASVVRLSGRVLLAEDGIDNQRLIALHLKRAGAEVDIAENGLVALEIIENAAANGESYDLLLTDMQMPEMDGYTLAQTLRSQGSTMPIVALTAHAMADDRALCLQAGCDDYASKPIDKLNLLITCANWMGKASSQGQRKMAA